MKIEYKAAAWSVTGQMKAVILAGGFGTRLRPLSCTRPKILFPIVNKPLLQWTFERLAGNNIKEVILAVSYQTEGYIKHHRIRRSGIHVKYSHDPLRKPLGTGGSIKKTEKLLGHSESFIVLNGDIFADVDYSEILKMHSERNATATIALCSVENPSRYGVAVLTDNNRIAQFIEKPKLETAPSRLINAGVYVLNPKVFKFIPKDRAVSIEHEVFPRLAEEGSLYGQIFNGLWMDIGKPEDYLQINKKMLDSLDLAQRYETKNGRLKNPVAIDRKVVIGQESTIGPYAVLGRDIIVGKQVKIKDSVLLPRTTISDFSTIDGAIVGEGVTIGKRTRIEKGCIIGDHARIKDNVILDKGVQICPADEVSKSVLTSSSNC